MERVRHNMQMEQQTSETEAFVQELTRHRAMIIRYSATLASNRADADELYQKTCLTLWEKWSAGVIPEAFGAWARAIALNHARNQIRANRRAPGLLTEELLEAIAARRQQTSDSHEHRLELLDQCREKLPAEHDQLLREVYGGNATVEQIARNQGRPVAGTYKLLQRIRKRLLDCVTRRTAGERRLP